MEADNSDKQPSSFNLIPATSDDSDDPEVVFGDHTQLMHFITEFESKEKKEDENLCEPTEEID
jgi:hypothetical protein